MAAGLAGIAATKAVGAEAAGIVRSVVNALEKPIYSNLETTTVTHLAENGDVTVRTKTKGWTIPLGIPVLIVGSVAVWEAANFVAQGLSKAAGVVTDVSQGAMNLATWPLVVVNLAQGAPVWAWNEAQGAWNAAEGFVAKAGQIFGVFPASSPAVQSLPKGVAVYARPPTAMASVSNLIQNLLDPIAATAGAYGPKVVSLIAPPT